MTQALIKFKDRLINLETQKRECAEDMKEIGVEMKSAGLSKDEIAGVKLAVRRSFESEDKRAARLTAEEVAESLGVLADMPLGLSAVERARTTA